MKIKKLLHFTLVLSFLFFVNQAWAGYQELCKYFKELPGWNSEECSGMQMSSNYVAGEMALKTYSKGEKQLTAMITKGNWAYAQTGINPAQLQNFEMNVQNKFFVKTLRIRGYKVVVSYSKEDNSGGIIVFLKEKNPQNPVIFLLNFEHMDWEEALDLAKKFDWDAMKSSF